MATPTKVITEVYISSGRKNALYTLRIQRSGGALYVDNYIRSLGRDPVECEAKAKDYFDRMFGGREDCFFAGFAGFELNGWGAPAPWEREQLDLIEQDIMPFGKHQGKSITDMDDGYVMWWAEQPVTEGTKRPAAALIDRMKGIALERDLYAKRDAKEAERLAEIAKRPNGHVGTVGERQEFTGTVRFVTSGENQWGETWFLTLVDTDEGAVLWWNTFGWENEQGHYVSAEAGSKISFHARVKSHDERDGEKQTIITRATRIKSLT
jgi:uncharacterized protein (DUF3820 family)